jgi:hypothetical protein
MTLPKVDFSQQRCLVCGGPAEKFRSDTLPEGALGRYIGRRLSYAGLVEIARTAGLTDLHCWTSMAGVSVCRTGQTPKEPRK